uniref:Uncharacterized protein n=1 Tax=Anguilla anguilla TaxID=7936 RepID=A0A0E9RY82_ANGAN
MHNTSQRSQSSSEFLFLIQLFEIDVLKLGCTMMDSKLNFNFGIVPTSVI